MNFREQFYAAALETLSGRNDTFMGLINQGNHHDEEEKDSDSLDISIHDEGEKDGCLSALAELYNEGDFEAVNTIAAAYAKVSYDEEAVNHYDMVFKCCKEYGADIYSVGLNSAIDFTKYGFVENLNACGLDQENFSSLLASAEKGRLKALHKGINHLGISEDKAEDESDDKKVDENANIDIADKYSYLASILFLMCQVFEAKEDELQPEELAHEDQQPPSNLLEEVVNNKTDFSQFIISRIENMTLEQQEKFLNYCVAVDKADNPIGFVSRALHSRTQYTFMDMLFGSYTQTSTVKYFLSLLEEIRKALLEEIEKDLSSSYDDQEEKEEADFAPGSHISQSAIEEDDRVLRRSEENLSNDSQEEEVSEGVDNGGFSDEDSDEESESERKSITEDSLSDNEKQEIVYSSGGDTSTLYASGRGFSGGEEHLEEEQVKNEEGGSSPSTSLVG